MKWYNVRSNAVRAARASLGKDAKKGADFTITEADGGYMWAAVEKAASAPVSPDGPTPIAIALAEPDSAPPAPAEAPAATDTPAVPTARQRAPKGQHAAILAALLARPEGATADDIVAATGWQRHTARGRVSEAGGVATKEGRGRVYRKDAA